MLYENKLFSKTVPDGFEPPTYLTADALPTELRNQITNTNIKPYCLHLCNPPLQPIQI